MDYFMLEPELRGWKTSHVLRVMPRIEIKSEFVPEKQLEKVRSGLEEFQDDKNEEWKPRSDIREYFENFNGVESRDVIILTSADTHYRKPPMNVRTELAATHPSNLNTRNISKRLEQLKDKKGKNSWFCKRKMQ